MAEDGEQFIDPEDIVEVFELGPEDVDGKALFL
jgi:hypothetical protein